MAPGFDIIECKHGSRPYPLQAVLFKFVVAILIFIFVSFLRPARQKENGKVSFDKYCRSCLNPNSNPTAPALSIQKIYKDEKAIIKNFSLRFNNHYFSSKKYLRAINTCNFRKTDNIAGSFYNSNKGFRFYSCLASPKVVLDNPRSFGNYDSSENILHTTDWKTLPPEAQKIFISLAAQLGNGETAEDAFEKGTHQWIFIHELGHWWRACQYQKSLPYDEEMAANRIATAYWREQDAALMNFQLGVFQNFIKHIPSPVPTGQSKRDFLNANYGKLPGGPTYTWFQSEMIVEAYNEQPILTFKEAIKNSGNSK